MDISLDGGALCARAGQRYGNYIFTYNLLKALALYDKENSYVVYSFCHKPKELKLPDSWSYRMLFPTPYWMKLRLSIEEFVKKKDIFLALNQSAPYITSSKIIYFSHGLSFLHYPQYYPKSLRELNNQLNDMILKSYQIVVSSQSIRQELSTLYKNCKNIIVIPYGIPFDMSEYESLRRERFFMFVGMNFPLKNVDFLVKVFRQFAKIKKFSHFKLYLVGNFSSYRSENIIPMSGVSRTKLKNLYQKATGYLTCSLYESFNLPVLEALSQKCPVIALSSAVIPEYTQYIQIAGREDQFLSRMVSVANGKHISYRLDSLKDRFSWKNYVNKLVNLYHSERL